MRTVPQVRLEGTSSLNLKVERNVNITQEQRMLEVKNVGGQLVVDSRLVAEQLGITHKTFKETIRTYENTITEAFGVMPVETAKPIGLKVRRTGS